MKKIIATVLAMVMALALCTTAFAASPKYDTIYDKKGNKVDSADTAVYAVETDTKASFDKDSGVGFVKTVKIMFGSTAYDGETYVESTKADYDLKLTADGRAPL